MRALVNWLVIIAISLMGALGGLLFKYGTLKFGEIQPQNFLDPQWSVRYLFTPAIFFGLVLLFLGRFLMGLPLSTQGLGKVTTLVTTLTIVFTVIASIITFNEPVTPRLCIGLALAVLSIILIGAE